MAFGEILSMFEAKNDDAEKKKGRVEKKEASAASGFAEKYDASADEGQALVGNTERINAELLALESDDAVVNDRGGGLKGVTEGPKTLQDYKDLISHDELNLENEGGLVTYKKLLNQERIVYEMLSSGDPEIVDAALSQLRLIALYPGSDLEIRLNSIQTIRDLRGDSAANSLCERIMALEGLDMDQRLNIGQALIENDKRAGEFALNRMLEGFPFVQRGFELMDLVQGLIEESGSVRMAHWGTELCTRIFILDDLDEKNRADYLDIVLDIGGDKAWEDAIVRLGEKSQIDPLWRGEFLLNLAEYNPNKARLGLRRITERFLSAPEDDQLSILEIIEEMGGVGDLGIGQEAALQAEKIADGKGVDREYRLRALSVIRENGGGRFFSVLGRVMANSRLPIADRTYLAEELIIAEGGMDVLVGLEAILESDKIKPKDRTKIVLANIAPHHYEWAQNFFLKIANAPHRNMGRRAEALKNLIKISEGHQRQEYVERLESIS